MPFGPHIIALLEDVLAEGFQYHQGLDNFVTRAGLSEARLEIIRTRAEERARNSQRGFARAPKRFVAQELLAELGSGKAEDDRLLAALVTGLCKGLFPEATPSARAAIEELKAQRVDERREAEEAREQDRRRQRTEERMREAASAEEAEARQRFRDRFIALSVQDNPQTRGYLLEPFLNEFLEFEGLDPRGSFKNLGEQIDGSFIWNGRTHLVEAKWVKEPVAGKEFSSLIYKVDGKTADTRGLFVSING